MAFLLFLFTFAYMPYYLADSFILVSVFDTSYSIYLKYSFLSYLFFIFILFLFSDRYIIFTFLLVHAIIIYIMHINFLQENQSLITILDFVSVYTDPKKTLCFDYFILEFSRSPNFIYLSTHDLITLFDTIYPNIYYSQNPVDYIDNFVNFLTLNFFFLGPRSFLLYADT